MTLSNRNSKLKATKSFIKMMSDMAEHAARQTAETMVPAQLQPIPVKSTARSIRQPVRPANMKWLFS